MFFPNIFYCIAILIITFLTTFTSGHFKGTFTERYRWKQIAFDKLAEDNIQFPDDKMFDHLEMEKEIIRSAEFIQYNNIPIGVTRYKNRLFITVPRRNPGVPSTLNYVYTNLPEKSSPRLRAYPSYRMNELHSERVPDETRLISVYRPRVDQSCSRLWFIDTGILEYRNNTVQIQPPALYIMNLENDHIIKRFEIPVEKGNGLVSITIDVDPKDCNDAYAYIPDMRNYKIHVYSLKDDRIWSFGHRYFEANPEYGKLTIDNLEFSWNDGVFSIALSNINPDGYRTAYLHPMASITEYTLSTKILKDESLSGVPLKDDEFKVLGERGDRTQSAMHGFDKHTGVIIYSQVNRNGAACWNTAQEFSPENHYLLAQNNNTMIYPADLSIDYDGHVWMMTNTMPRFIYSKLDPNEYNYRLWTAKVSDVVQGTPCGDEMHLL